MLYMLGMKIITMSALILALSSGAAFADRHGGDWGHGGRAWVHESHNNGWSGGVHVRTAPREYNRHAFHSEYRGYRGGYYPRYGGYSVVRRPIYVHRPFIRERY